jgi:group I intron endonuclease
MENSLFLVYGVVYLIKNIVNGKVYVGQTVASLRLRLRNHVSHAFAWLTGKYKGQDTPLFRAIRKYGKESFNISVVCSCQSKEELDLMEDFCILLLGGSNKKTGYNLRRGGANGKMSQEVKDFCGSLHKGRKHTAEARQKMSETTKKQLALNPRPPVSDLTREKMRQSSPRKCLWSEETKQRVSKMFSGAGGSNYYHEVDTQELIRLYELGHSCKSISLLIPQITDGGILRRLRAAGVQMRTPWSKVKPHLE